MLVEALKPLKVLLPDGDLHLRPGCPIDLPAEQAKKLLERAPGKVRCVPRPPLTIQETAVDAYHSLVAVRIKSPVIGEFWFCLSETEPFDPGDGLPLYRPSEIRALVGKGYSPEALQAVHRLKTTLDGPIRR